MTSGLFPSNGAQALIDIDALARMASAMFSALPGDQLRTAGVQAPINLAPAGSPLASPTSRCAQAKRVIESIIKRTFFPVEEKYSAIAVATKAPLILSNGL